MIFLNKYIKGDKCLLSCISFLALFSILPIYSVNSCTLNNHNKAVYNLISKHVMYIIIGFIVLIISYKIKYQYIVATCIITMPLTILLLIITLLQGHSSNYANSARWIRIPIINVSFQTSSFASLVITIYCANYISKNYNHNFIKSCLYLFLPIIVTLLLILPANASSAIILLFSIILILFIGQYPLKNILILSAIIIISITTFIIIGLKFKNHMPFNRIVTWKNRIYNFINRNKKEEYQISKSKLAILLGRVFGIGPGKSIFIKKIPQSYSDFIYSIIVEEYGIVGGLIILIIYLIILFRIIIIATKSKTYFSSLLVISLGFPVITQALIHMYVNISILPVTGQNLPLISAGGTSICVSFLRFGMILNISNNIKNISNEKKS